MHGAQTLKAAFMNDASGKLLRQLNTAFPQNKEKRGACAFDMMTSSAAAPVHLFLLTGLHTCVCSRACHIHSCPQTEAGKEQKRRGKEVDLAPLVGSNK